MSLNLAALQQKLIHEKRGGYCFEQNLLLRAVLLALGFEVKNLAARVLWNLPAEIITPRSHMLLQVTVDGAPCLADVGFGGLTLTTPIALVPDIEQSTSHEPFRLTKTDHIYILQAKIRQEWQSLYQFDLQEQQLPDYEMSNWYVSTHPNSLFVNNLIVARPDFNCRYALQNNQFAVHYLDGQTERHILSTTAELRAALENYFGLNLGAITALGDDKAPAKVERMLQQMIEKSS